MDLLTEPVLLALMMAILLMLVFWPEKTEGPIEDYLRILSPVYWKEESEIYDQILKLHPMFGLKEHEKMLSYLLSKKKVERRIGFPHAITETETPNGSGRVYVDHIEPFSTITAVRYRLSPRRGGRRRRVRMPAFAPA